MVNKEQIYQIVREQLDDNNIFIVDITVSARNSITVYLDSYKGLTLDDCEHIHKKIYPLIEDIERDFELTVSSPGLTNEFKVWQQYHKNKGQEVETVLKDGRMFRGVIEVANEHEFTLKTKKQNITLPYTDIKRTKLVLKF